MDNVRGPQPLGNERFEFSFRPFAAVFAIRGPVDTVDPHQLSKTITCVASYTSTSNGQDSDADIDIDCV